MRAQSISSTIALVGWRNWLWYALRLDDARDWVLRVLNCHHNARRVAALEQAMIDVQFACTNGELANPNCSAEETVDAIAAECHRMLVKSLRQAQCPVCGHRGMKP